MPRGGPVISHWHTLVDGFNTSSLDFYKSVEEAVKAREVPDATFLPRRVQGRWLRFRQAGVPPGRARECRLRHRSGSLRQGLLLLMVAVPPRAGTPVPLPSWLPAGSLHRHANPGLPLRRLLRVLSGTAVCSCGIVVGLALLARKEVFGPEEHILAIPILGWIYEKIFNPITYYSLDTALMFQESVSRAVNEVIEGLLTGQGLRALSEDQLKPTIRDLAG